MLRWVRTKTKSTHRNSLGGGDVAEIFTALYCLAREICHKSRQELDF
jgi:hypothetical protein